MRPSPALPIAGMSPSLKARVASIVARSRDPVARGRAGTGLELYYEAGDPHSQLCAQVARRLLPRLSIPFDVRLVPAPEASTYPEEARQRQFAAIDAARIAPCHGLDPPRALDRAALEARLAIASGAQQFLDIERTGAGAAASAQQVQAVLARNAARRRRLNHYLPAMWQFRGEWFWALDRLGFLERRLREAGALRGEESLTSLDAARLPEATPAPGAPLEFWFSFRSPYSYVAAVELLRRCERGLKAPLVVLPVLPMVMRGLPVPRAKKFYIVRDVQRCADEAGIAFGQIHDPVGQGALRLLTVFPYESDPMTQLRYCAIGAQTSWAEGLDVCRDDVLRTVFERCGLDWPTAQAKLAAGIDTSRAEANRERLFAAGLWGVPCFRLGAFTTWGQDRLWMVDRLLSS